MGADTNTGLDWPVAYGSWRRTPALTGFTELLVLVRRLLEVPDEECEVTRGPINGPQVAYDFEGRAHLLMATGAGPQTIETRETSVDPTVRTAIHHVTRDQP
ncbi:hypothetical protein ABTY61_22935 [Kitasatospora sp. NPDC096128]|uniref:hypothetical protein n=1 Tax=Kitasatospora sp. NPDC096128 TaxID=3155547 RepID=UPI0033318856